MVQALARWCTKTGFEDAARLHYAQVLASNAATDEMRSEATTKLDLSLVNGTWLTRDELIDEEQEQRDTWNASCKWQPVLIEAAESD